MLYALNQKIIQIYNAKQKNLKGHRIFFKNQNLKLLNSKYLLTKRKNLNLKK
jgi:hypothetical protein